MTEQWRGLHNEDQHEYPSDSGAYCRTCAGVVCWEDTPCYCCLAAEVEALRAQVQAVRELHRPCADPDLHDGAHCCPECSDFGRSSIFRPWPCPTARALGGDA